MKKTGWVAAGLAALAMSTGAATAQDEGEATRPAQRAREPTAGDPPCSGGGGATERRRRRDGAHCCAQPQAQSPAVRGLAQPRRRRGLGQRVCLNKLPKALFNNHRTVSLPRRLAHDELHKVHPRSSSAE